MATALDDLQKAVDAVKALVVSVQTQLAAASSAIDNATSGTDDRAAVAKLHETSANLKNLSNSFNESTPQLTKKS